MYSSHFHVHSVLVSDLVLYLQDHKYVDIMFKYHVNVIKKLLSMILISNDEYIIYH